MPAKIYPDPNSFYPNNKAERKFFNIVKNLNSSWTAYFNSVKGIGKEESDCILVHKNYGIFSIEVKGGRQFLIEDGQWSRLENAGYKKIKSPLEQAENHRGTVIKILQKIKKFPDSYSIIVLPEVIDLSLPEDYELYGFSKEIVITKGDLENLNLKLKNASDFVLTKEQKQRRNVTFNKDDLNYLKSQLLPTLYFPDIKSRKDVKGKKIIEMDNKQIEAWKNSLDQRNPAVIKGQSGTGKTILARALAKQRSESGLKTILICKQLLLNRENKSALSDTSVDSFAYYELLFFLIENMSKENLSKDHIFKFVNEKLKEKNFNPHRGFQGDVYEHIALKSKDILKIFSGTYDAVIIDEGQQFNKDELEAFKELLTTKNKNTITVFSDPDQSKDMKWEQPEWLIEYPPLQKNYRNTNAIVKQQEGVLNKELYESDFFGAEPSFTYIKSDNKFFNALIKDWKLLIKNGVSEKDIVILSTSRTLIESMRSLNKEKNLIPNNQFFTVEEFTGLEKYAAIVLWSEAMTQKFSFLDRKRRAYQAIGRAEDHLFIISTEPKESFYQNIKRLKK